MSGPQVTIDFEAAKLARDAGIAQALQHAEEVTPRWADKAFEAFRAYASTHHLFTMEQVRAALPVDFPPPPSQRAWGGVAVRAKKAGMVVHDAWTTADDPRVHCNVVRIWRSTICQGAAP